MKGSGMSKDTMQSSSKHDDKKYYKSFEGEPGAASKSTGGNRTSQKLTPPMCVGKGK